MGGHGGLNILPQKRWNVYNYENREKVKRDEEAAAKEEQLKREQSRKRDAELRLEKLRQARGLSNPSTQAETSKPASTSTSTQTPADHSKESESDSNHINLFEGIKIFDPIKAGEGERVEKKGRFWRDNNINGNKKVKREEQVRAVNPEDEKYRMGYGVAGKGVKLPWYMEKRRNEEKTGDTDNDNDYDTGMAVKGNRKGAGGKKSLEELREERLKRERMEKEREKALVMEKSRREGGFSSRRR